MLKIITLIVGLTNDISPLIKTIVSLSVTCTAALMIIVTSKYLHHQPVMIHIFLSLSVTVEPFIDTQL